MKNLVRVSIQVAFVALALSSCGGSEGSYEVRIGWDSRPGHDPDFFEPGFNDTLFPPDAFAAEVTVAPPHGATVSGLVRLEVVGRNMRDVALLPEAGYTPVYVRFLLSRDGSFAYADFDTREVPNGALEVRISAFSQAPGKPGGWESVAMRPRTWQVLN